MLAAHLLDSLFNKGCMFPNGLSSFLGWVKGVEFCVLSLLGIQKKKKLEVGDLHSCIVNGN